MDCIAVDIGGTHLRVARVSRSGTVRAEKIVAMSRRNSPVMTVDQIGKLCGEWAQGSRMNGMGIAVPGFLDAGRSTVLFSPNLPRWKNVPLVKMVRDRLRFSCAIENDANCAALGEKWRGAAKSFEDFILLTLGTGVGGGVLLEGRLIIGSRGAGGELGHVLVDPEGPLCGCGNRGCLETFVSARAMERRTGLDPKILYQRAANGNASALREFSLVGKYLAMGIASFCFTLDPKAVVLGGNVSRAFAFFVPALRAELRKRLRNHPAKDVRIVKARFPNDAGLLGAASLMWSPNRVSAKITRGR